MYQRLLTLADPDYRAFQSKLLPGVSDILGVRLPKLRKLAKELARSDWRGYLEDASDNSFEEIMLQGMVIGYAKADHAEILTYTARFIPKIDNWSVCDSFCSGLKLPRTHPEAVREFLTPYLRDDREFFVRFGVVMLLNYYVSESELPRTLTSLDQVRHEGYYAKMAVAWAISVCFAKASSQTSTYLKSCTLDDFTYRKALQKITESHRADPQALASLRACSRLTTITPDANEHAPPP